MSRVHRHLGNNDPKWMLNNLICRNSEFCSFAKRQLRIVSECQREVRLKVEIIRRVFRPIKENIQAKFDVSVVLPTPPLGAGIAAITRFFTSFRVRLLACLQAARENTLSSVNCRVRGPFSGERHQYRTLQPSRRRTVSTVVSSSFATA